MNWLDGIGRDDLHENYQEMMDVITLALADLAPEARDGKAIEIILKLSGHYNSQAFYFRSLKEIISERKKRYIIDKCNGHNHEALARATGFSLAYVYEILAAERTRKQLSFLN